VRTYARDFGWLDEGSLWTSAADVCPGSAKTHDNLGNAGSHLPGPLSVLTTTPKVWCACPGRIDGARLAGINVR
jgi:hypothetical protein